METFDAALDLVFPEDPHAEQTWGKYYRPWLPEFTQSVKLERIVQGLAESVEILAKAYPETNRHELIKSAVRSAFQIGMATGIEMEAE